MTDALSALTQSSSQTGLSRSESSQASLTETYDDFLTLLTTQLQYQDPLEPTDSTEFTNQLVQFSQVEQQIQMNQNLEGLLQLQESADLQSALSYIGLDVETRGTQFTLAQGGSDFGYALPDSASSVEIRIVDPLGQTVRSLDGATSPGAHAVRWDGVSDQGVQMDPGTDYQVQINAFDLDGELMQDVVTTTTDRVTGVETSSGIPALVMGSGLTMGLNDVLYARLPGASTLPAAPPSTSAASSDDTAGTGAGAGTTDDQAGADDSAPPPSDDPASS